MIIHCLAPKAAGRKNSRSDNRIVIPAKAGIKPRGAVFTVFGEKHGAFWVVYPP
jgi:hypothetical protein